MYKNISRDHDDSHKDRYLKNKTLTNIKEKFFLVFLFK